MSLPATDRSFDAVVSGLALNFVPDPAKAAAETGPGRRRRWRGRSVRLGLRGEMQLRRYFWDAAVTLDPAAREIDDGVRYGLSKTRSRPRVVPRRRAVRRRGPDHRRSDSLRRLRRLLDAVSRGQAPAASYAMSLDDQRRSALRERIRSALPAADDGTIALTARAGRWGTARADQYARCLMRASKVVPSAGLVTPRVGSSQRRRTADVPELSPQCRCVEHEHRPCTSA